MITDVLSEMCQINACKNVFAIYETISVPNCTWDSSDDEFIMETYGSFFHAVAKQVELECDSKSCKPSKSNWNDEAYIRHFGDFNMLKILRV